MRLVIARCQVDYAGRLTAHLPMATRLLIVKADGSVLVHSDGGSYKPLNWMSPPCTLSEGTTEDGAVEWMVEAKSGDTLRILIEEVHQRHLPRPRHRPRPAEGRRREAPAGAARRPPGDASRRADAWYAASSPPRSARSTCSAATRRARRRGRDQAPRRDRRRRAAHPLPRPAQPRPAARPGPRHLRRPGDQAAGARPRHRPRHRLRASSTTTPCAAWTTRAPAVLIGVSASRR